jgi:hypothetical protein
MDLDPLIEEERSGEEMDGVPKKLSIFPRLDVAAWKREAPVVVHQL